MSNLLNRTANKSKQAIANEANRDLINLRLARRRADQLGVNPPPRRLSETSNNNRVETSSDDSDIEIEPKTKQPRVSHKLSEPVTNNDDEIIVIREFIGSNVASPLQLNLASDRLPTKYDTQAIASTSNVVYEDRVPSPSISNDLAGFLESEIKIEHQNHMNLSGKNEPTIKDFEIRLNGQAEVKLVKIIGDEHLQITFNVNNSLYLPPNESSVVSLPQLTIELLKGAHRLCFNATLVKTDGFFNIQIESFYHLSVAQNEPNPVANKEQSDTYQASLQNCPPNLRELFQDLLRQRGLNSEFCKELVDYATFNEHFAYLDLLSKTKNFVESL